MELLRSILKKVSEQLVVLNKELAVKKLQWSISEPLLVENKLSIVVQLDKKGELITQKFFVWERNEHAYNLQKEGDEVQVSLKADIVKRIAMEVYGGQVIGTSLIDDDWARRHFKHLNTVPAT
ncbi:MAG: hypothetical protein WAW11_00660 [Patescibacteria group bacterium]